MTKQDLLMASLQPDSPSLALSYSSLANSLGRTETVTLPDGRQLSRRELYLLALHHASPMHAYYFSNLASTLDAHESITLLDKRQLNKQELLLEAIRCNPDKALPYHHLAQTLAVGKTIALPDGRCLAKHELLIEAVWREPTRSDAAKELLACLPHHHGWTRRLHVATSDAKTNVLFAALFLGLQRLENAGALALAHQAMLEEMLECWTWGHSCALRTKQSLFTDDDDDEDANFFQD